MGEKREYLTIKILHNDMTVNVPAENAERVGLRKVIDEEAVKKVVKYLTSGGTEMPKNWNRRFKHNRDKMKTGDIFELAEVVRNLSLRDGEKGLSTGEKQMYVKAKKILASELMYAKNLTEDDASRWLEDVLTGPDKKPAAAKRPAAAKKPRRCRASRRLRRTPRRTAAKASDCPRASGPSSSPRGAASGSERTARRRLRGSASSRCSPSRCDGSTSASGSTRSSSSRRRTGRSRRSCSPRSSARRRWPPACRAARRRSASVRAGLAEVPDDAAVVLVHDAARPLLPPELVPRLLEALGEGFDGAVPGLPGRRHGQARRRTAVVVETLARDELVAVQTPQAFAATCCGRPRRGEGSDCASLVEAAGGRVKVVAGDERLLKVTTRRRPRARRGVAGGRRRRVT